MTIPTPATFDVRSNALPMAVAVPFIIGSDAANATLLITNGATLLVPLIGTDIGATSVATNSRVVISGPGSIMTGAGTLIFGDASSGNEMLIGNGGAVVSSNATIGYQTGADDSSVMITAPARAGKSTAILP